MLRLKNRYQSPIGGFQFTDPQISSEPLQTYSFDELVQAVIERRKQNPRFNLSLSATAVIAEVDRQNTMRMMSLSGGNHYVVGQDEPGEIQPNRRTPQADAMITIDWLGPDGKPVTAELAEKRAAVCAGCALNQPVDWTAVFTELAADKIRQQLQIRTELGLNTKSDDALQLCAACHCPNKLKIHAPLKHILAHTTAEKLAPGCWVLTESRP